MNKIDYRAAMLLATLAFGCDSDGEKSEGEGADNVTESGSDPKTPSGDEGEEESGDGGGTCLEKSPEGSACESGDDCSVSCLCSGGAVSSGSCVNGACADPDESCAEACESLEAGSYRGTFCAVPGADDDDDQPDAGEAPGEDEGTECVPTGDACAVNGDCCGFADEQSLCVDDVCSDLCFFDSDCVSGCCAPLTTGGFACAPASVCA